MALNPITQSIWGKKRKRNTAIITILELPLVMIFNNNKKMHTTANDFITTVEVKYIAL